MDIDVLGDSQKDLGDNAKKTIASVAMRLRDRHRQLADIMKMAELVKKEIQDLETHELPQVMSEIGMKKYTLSDGTEVEVKDVVSAGTVKPTHTEVLNWLREHGHSGLIKSHVSVEFDRGHEQEANLLVSELEEQGQTVTIENGVHAMTFSAWAREQLAQGTDLPLELLGIWVGKRAKMKLPKGEANG